MGQPRKSRKKYNTPPHPWNAERIKNENKIDFGYNARTEEYVDMISAGIVDPVKVTRSALQNAASVASMVLTTESLVTDIPEPAAPAAPMDPGMGMY